MSANTVKWNSAVPAEVLEMQATEQRRRIHDSIRELRSQVQHALDIRRQVRDHMKPVTAMMTGLGLLLGYRITGLFTRPR